MNTAEKVRALLTFYSARYRLSTTDWLEGLIELESSPNKGGDNDKLNRWSNPPYACEHCGKKTQYGMGARRHHTLRHHSCSEEHTGMREGNDTDGKGDPAGA